MGSKPNSKSEASSADAAENGSSPAAAIEGGGESSGERSMTEQTIVTIRAPEDDAAPGRLDKTLFDASDEALGLSRSRLTTLIQEGRLSLDGETLRDPARKVKPGAAYVLRMPPIIPAEPEPEPIPLDVVFEDDALLVVNKPAGLTVHPAPGAPTGTLVNALLHHCGDTLSGVGGAARPGIVHRLDKETSGLLVVAKHDRAHRGLAEQFAAHTALRRYVALCFGAPNLGDPRLMGLPGVTSADGALRIAAPIGRHPYDRKRMAVVRRGGRDAVTWVTVEQTFGRSARPAAARIRCRLETGRTHQIRVHLAQIGHPLIGDPLYGRGRSAPAASKGDAADASAEGIEAAARVAAFARQALHAAVLGFDHPITGAALAFERPPPPDFAALAAALTSAYGPL